VICDVHRNRKSNRLKRRWCIQWQKVGCILKFIPADPHFFQEDDDGGAVDQCIAGEVLMARTTGVSHLVPFSLLLKNRCR
jgi:hypothetical protein